MRTVEKVQTYLDTNESIKPTDNPNECFKEYMKTVGISFIQDKITNFELYNPLNEYTDLDIYFDEYLELIYELINKTISLEEFETYIELLKREKEGVENDVRA